MYTQCTLMTKSCAHITKSCAQNNHMKQSICIISPPGLHAMLYVLVTKTTFNIGGYNDALNHMNLCTSDYLYLQKTY